MTIQVYYFNTLERLNRLKKSLSNYKDKVKLKDLKAKNEGT